MHESHDMIGGRDDSVRLEAWLREIPLAAPRLDRDRLMYLAGRRSVRGPRRAVFWPVSAVASWIACSVIVGMALNRPPEIVTRTRVVERVITAPEEVAGVERTGGVTTGDRSGTDSMRPAASVLPNFDPWTPGFEFAASRVLSARPDLFEGPLAVAEGPSAGPSELSPMRPPASYADLRRELLPEAVGSVGWF